MENYMEAIMYKRIIYIYMKKLITEKYFLASVLFDYCVHIHDLL